MSDSFTETASQGWFSRILESIKSVVVGLAFFLISFVVLFWNEGRAVQTARSLEEGAAVVVSISETAVGAGNEGKLVHLSGEATTQETLTDPEFNVSVPAIKLVRNVEMYQWTEHKKSEEKKKLGGGTETVTTYTYDKKWSSDLIDSSDFKEPQGHGNPPRLPISPLTVVASKVTLGAFTLSAPVVDRLDEKTDIPVTEAMAAALPAAMKAKLKPQSGGYYMGADPAVPSVGDARVTFQAVRPARISLVARQVRDTFEAYAAEAGDQILLVKYGTLSAAAMFEAAQRENTVFTWILRFVGFFMMFLGLVMVFRPISVVGDVIPLVGTLLGAGLAVFAALTAFILSLGTIAVAWIFYRPLLAIVLIVLAVGGLVLLVTMGRRKRAAAPAVRQGAA